jgi:hypothetical protein
MPREKDGGSAMHIHVHLCFPMLSPPEQSSVEATLKKYMETAEKAR